MPTTIHTRSTSLLSLLLAAVATTTLLGSIDLLAAERVAAARQAQALSQASAQATRGVACGLNG